MNSNDKIVRGKKRECVENWLKRNESRISIRSIERELELPQGTIHKAIKYGRTLSNERIRLLHQFIMDFKKY